jgi:hypothetical protein
MDIYQELLEGRASLSKLADEETIGMDDFFTDNQIKVASIDDFFQFVRLGNNTLVHKADKDLWRVAENDKGEVIIERLFDPSTKQPLRI